MSERDEEVRQLIEQWLRENRGKIPSVAATVLDCKSRVEAAQRLKDEFSGVTDEIALYLLDLRIGDLLRA